MDPKFSCFTNPAESESDFKTIRLDGYDGMTRNWITLVDWIGFGWIWCLSLDRVGS